MHEAQRVWMTSTVSWAVQVAGTSRGSGGAPSYRGGHNVGSLRPPAAPVPAPSADTSTRRAQEKAGTLEMPPSVLAVRDGEPVPAGYRCVVRDTAHPHTSDNPRDTVDLTTQPEGPEPVGGEDADIAKQSALDRRKANRNTNKHLQASFAKEVKESLAGGRPPVVTAREDQAHLKTRWHSAAKDAAYRLLDMRKESWKEYTIFDKGLVHNELRTHYKFDPPLDMARVDKYLAGHLRSQRAVWKAHWLKNGDSNRHPNCPEEAWATLIKWWPTAKCKSESAAMAGRRSKALNNSKTGRKRLVDKMNEQVRQSKYMLNGWAFPFVRSGDALM